MGKILSGIKGERFPIINNEPEKYGVILNENADVASVKEDEILWQLYWANEYSEYEKVPFSGQKKGKEITITFKQALLDKNLQLKATYKGETVELHITPQSNGEEKIIDVFFLDVEYKAQDKDNLKYLNSLNLQIYTLNMLGKYVEFKIYDTVNGQDVEVAKNTEPIHVIQKNGIVKTKKSILLSPGMYMQTQKDMSASEHHYKIKVWERGNESNFYEEELKVKNEMGIFSVAQDSQVPVKTGTSEPPKPKEDKKDEKCFCDRDFTVDEMIGIIYNLRDKQKMISKRDVFFNMGGEYISSLRVSTGKLTDDVNKAKIKLFTDELNSMFKKFSINTCKRKIHFIGQMYLETIYFRYTYESRSSVPSNYGGGVPFQGRGMKQITHDYNYLSYYDYVNNTKMYDKYDKYRNRPKDKIESVGDCIKRSSEARKDGLDVAFYEKLKIFAKNLSQNLFHSFNSAGWYSTVRQRRTIDAMDEGFADEIIKKVTKAINGGDNGLVERINFTNWTKEYLKYDSKCINK